MEYGVAGGVSDDKDATGNTVTINGGTVNGPDGMYGGGSATGNATGNIFIINGGTVNGTVVGGRADEGNATGNTVIIGKEPVFGDDGEMITIFGGAGAKDSITGNTLIFDKYKGGGAVFGIANFEKIEFILSAETKNKGTVLDVTEFTQLDGAKFEITGVEAGSALAEGDKITLMTNIFRF